MRPGSPFCLLATRVRRYLAGMLSAVLLFTIPLAEPAVERVDRVEVNHVYDGQAQHRMTQVIGWDWVPHCSRYHVAWWFLADAPPTIEHTGPGRTITTHAGGDLVRIEASQSIETWTQWDREVDERAFLPQEDRRGFSRQAPKLIDAR